MSEEFIRVATGEINSELEEISNILTSCQSDKDVFHKSSEIKKHLHKIKGLAPMMGKTQIGEISSILDSILKQVIDGKMIDDVFVIIKQSTDYMKKNMRDDDFDLGTLKNEIKTKYSIFIN